LGEEHVVFVFEVVDELLLGHLLFLVGEGVLVELLADFALESQGVEHVFVCDVDLVLFYPWGQLAGRAAVFGLVIGEQHLFVVLFAEYSLALVALDRIVERNRVTDGAYE
jgi:hypothetical protein